MLSVRKISTIVVFASWLLSCSADDGQSQIELYQPDSIRQTLAYNSSNLVVRISVNGGASQSFALDGSASSTVVSVSGIQLGEQNEISITWVEVADGRNIELSMQQQSFNADGNTVIDASHSFGVFDYDGDSVSNYDERVAGTCVWSSDEQCTDVPTSPDLSENLLTNGDFSNGGTGWFALGVNPFTVEGEYCISSPSNAAVSTASYIAHGSRIQLERGLNYVYAFDIKADFASSIVSSATNVESDGTSRLIFEELVTVSTNYERKVLQFSPASNWSAAQFGVSLGPNPDVRFCIDNMSLTIVE